MRLLLLLLGLFTACGDPRVVSTGDAGADGGVGVEDAGAIADAGVATLPDGGALRGPPYPIVLAHGFFGFETFAGLDFLTYFYEVKDELAAHGELEVFTTTVDPFNTSEVRAARLLEQLEQIRVQTGAAKVNLIGHSQGGLDARIVAHQRPDLVASVTTFSTPHLGTPVSDIVARGLSDPTARAIVDALVGVVASPLWSEATSRSSITSALSQFESGTMRAFNTTWTNVPGVIYLSFAGRSGMQLAEDECKVSDPGRPDFVKAFDGTRDPLDSLLTTTGAVLSPNVFDPLAHDGLVPVASAKWGTFLGCVPADHLDEVGQLPGLPPGALNDWRHKPFYVDVVRLLRARGL